MTVHEQKPYNYQQSLLKYPEISQIVIEEVNDSNIPETQGHLNPKIF